MLKLWVVALLVVAAQAQTKDQRSSSYETADQYQHNNYYPASEYDGHNNNNKFPSFFNTNLDSWINLGLNVLILVLIGFVAFTVSASIGSVIENADDDRGLNLRGMDIVGSIERLQKLYDSIVATSA